MAKFDFDYDFVNIAIWGNPKYINDKFFRSIYKAIKPNEPIPYAGYGALFTDEGVLQTIDNPSTGIYVLIGAKLYLEGLYQEPIWICKDEWGNDKYICKTEDLGHGFLVISVYERLLDTVTGKYYGGKLVNLADQDFIIARNINVPCPKNLPLLYGDKLNDDYSITRANGDIVYPDTSILHSDGSTTDINGDLHNLDGTIIKPDGTKFYPDGSYDYLRDGEVVGRGYDNPETYIINADEWAVYKERYNGNELIESTKVSSMIPTENAYNVKRVFTFKTFSNGQPEGEEIYTLFNDGLLGYDFDPSMGAVSADILAKHFFPKNFEEAMLHEFNVIYDPISKTFTKVTS